MKRLDRSLDFPISVVWALAGVFGEKLPNRRSLVNGGLNPVCARYATSRGSRWPQTIMSDGSACGSRMHGRALVSRILMIWFRADLKAERVLCSSLLV